MFPLRVPGQRYESLMQCRRWASTAAATAATAASSLTIVDLALGWQRVRSADCARGRDGAVSVSGGWWWGWRGGGGVVPPFLLVVDQFAYANSKGEGAGWGGGVLCWVDLSRGHLTILRVQH